MRTNNSSYEFRLMAWVKGIVCVVLVLTVAYSVVASVEIPDVLLKFIVGMIAVYFGLSARFYKNGAG